MEKNSQQNDTKAVVRNYEKPVTVKHEAMNTVQGSSLYGSNLYGGLYYVKLYYYY